MSVRRTVFWLAAISGLAAAYMMYRRGEPLGKSIKRAANHPVGELAHELTEAWKDHHTSA